MTGGVFFWVQYLLGVGHLQRALRIADALVANGVAVTLACGGPPAPLARDPRIRFVQLPAVRARDASFALFDETGTPLDDALRERRRAALVQAFCETQPDAVVLEGFPFARRAFRFEIDPLIAAARSAQPRPRLFSSIRDILVARDDPARDREIVERVRRDFDAVLVHGDPALIPLDASFPAAPQIADRLFYTGYVSAAERIPGAVGEGEVLVSAGGGAAGRLLLETALAARRLGALADRKWRFLAGPNLPLADFAELQASAPAGVVVERFRHDLMSLLRGCRVSVSQAGYNTVLETLLAQARAVFVPFAAGRETEQLVRAERFAALGRAELVRETELSPERLARAIERAAVREPPALVIDSDGAMRSARLIAGWTVPTGLAADPKTGMTGK
jgi:predicted glycosyltransferase